MVLDNCSYNKIKLLHEMSSLLWFIDHHAIQDAEKSGDQQCKQQLELIKKDLAKHIEQLQRSMCQVTH
jgi:hypothetical protein